MAIHELFIGEFKQFVEAIEVFEECVRSEFGNDERIDVLLKGALVYSARGVLGVQYNFDKVEMSDKEARRIFDILKQCIECVPYSKAVFVPPIAVAELRTTYAKDETITDEEAVRRLARRYAWETKVISLQNPTPIMFCEKCGLVWEYETVRRVLMNSVTYEITDRRGTIDSFALCYRCGKELIPLKHKAEILAYLKRYILSHPKTSRKEKMFLQELVKEKVLEAAKVAPLLI